MQCLTGQNELCLSIEMVASFGVLVQWVRLCLGYILDLGHCFSWSLSSGASGVCVDETPSISNSFLEPPGTLLSLILGFCCPLLLVCK